MPPRKSHEKRQNNDLVSLPIQNDIPKTLCHAGKPAGNAKRTTSSVQQYKTAIPKRLCHAGNQREMLKRPRQFINTKWHPGQKRLYATPEKQQERLKDRPRQFTNTKRYYKNTMPRRYRFSTNTTIIKADYQLTRPVTGLVWLTSFNTPTCLQRGTGGGRDPRSQKVAKEVNST